MQCIITGFTPESRGLGTLAEKLEVTLFPIDEDDEIWPETDTTDHGTTLSYDALMEHAL